MPLDTVASNRYNEPLLHPVDLYPPRVLDSVRKFFWGRERAGGGGGEKMLETRVLDRINCFSLQI